MKSFRRLRRSGCAKGLWRVESPAAALKMPPPARACSHGHRDGDGPARAVDVADVSESAGLSPMPRAAQASPTRPRARAGPDARAACLGLLVGMPAAAGHGRWHGRSCTTYHESPAAFKLSTARACSHGHPDGEGGMSLTCPALSAGQANVHASALRRAQRWRRLRVLEPEPALIRSTGMTAARQLVEGASSNLSRL